MTNETVTLAHIIGAQRKAIRFFIAVGLFALFAGHAKAATTAGEMKENCATITSETTSTDPFRAGLCLGYITGWVSAVNGMHIASENGTVYVLSGNDNMKIWQAERVFVLYVTQHPECENKPVGAVLVDALIAAKLFKLEVIPVRTTN